MQSLITPLLGITTGLSSYYIYKYHQQHFKETIFLKSVETYSHTKMNLKKYFGDYINFENENQNKNQIEKPIQIIDLKLIQNNQSTINNLNPNMYSSLSWNLLSEETKVHLVYRYQEQTFRAILSFGDNLAMFDSDFDWLNNTLPNSIDSVDTNLSDPRISELMQMYAGPFEDFYQLDQVNYQSFLNYDLTEFIFSGPMLENHYNPFIEVFDIMGDSKIFGTKVSKK